MPSIAKCTVLLLPLPLCTIDYSMSFSTFTIKCLTILFIWTSSLHYVYIIIKVLPYPTCNLCAKSVWLCIHECIMQMNIMHRCMAVDITPWCMALWSVGRSMPGVCLMCGMYPQNGVWVSSYTDIQLLAFWKNGHWDKNCNLEIS